LLVFSMAAEWTEVLYIFISNIINDLQRRDENPQGQSRSDNIDEKFRSEHFETVKSFDFRVSEFKIDFIWLILECFAVIWIRD
jgi:hypothetical protein